MDPTDQDVIYYDDEADPWDDFDIVTSRRIMPGDTVKRVVAVAPSLPVSEPLDLGVGGMDVIGPKISPTPVVPVQPLPEPPQYVKGRFLQAQRRLIPEDENMDFMEEMYDIGDEVGDIFGFEDGDEDDYYVVEADEDVDWGQTEYDQYAWPRRRVIRRPAAKKSIFGTQAKGKKGMLALVGVGLVGVIAGIALVKYTPLKDKI